MNLIKLAFRNLRRSFRDYTIYFVTLLLAITLFQMFRTATSQAFFRSLIQDGFFMAVDLTEIMQIVSWFMLVVLAFLIVFANRFMFKRRSRELAMLQILGMQPTRLALLLAFEISLVNALAIGFGLLLGTFWAQWLSLFILQSLGQELNAYRFVYSPEATRATLLSFVGITGLVLLIITTQLNKLDPADLLRPKRKERKDGQLQRLLPWVSLVIAVLSLGTAYYWVLTVEPQAFVRTASWAIVLGIVGTFALMYALTTLIIRIPQRFPRVYYKGLRFFGLRNMSFRLHSFWVSLATSSLLIFFTLSVLLMFFTGTARSKLETTVYEHNARYDLQYVRSRTFDQETEAAQRCTQRQVVAETYQRDIVEVLEPLRAEGRYGLLAYDVLSYFPVSSDSLYAVHSASDQTSWPEEREAWNKRHDVQSLAQGYNYYFLSVMTHSEAERIMARAGRPWEVDAEKHLLFAHPTAQYAEELVQWLGKEQMDLVIEEEGSEATRLRVDQYRVETEAWPILGSANRLLLLVPDPVIEALNPRRFVQDVALQTVEDPEQEDLRELRQLLMDTPAAYGQGMVAYSSFDLNPREILAYEQQDQAMVTLVGVYFSVNFLLTCATILALQYLSEVSDNRRRYRMLGQLGAQPRVLSKQIAKETGLYFALPIGVALMSAAVAFRMLGDKRLFFERFLVRAQIPSTLAVVLGFLLLYFLLTLSSALRMVGQNGDKR